MSKNKVRKVPMVSSNVSTNVPRINAIVTSPKIARVIVNPYSDDCYRVYQRDSEALDLQDKYFTCPSCKRHYTSSDLKVSLDEFKAIEDDFDEYEYGGGFEFTIGIYCPHCHKRCYVFNGSREVDLSDSHQLASTKINSLRAFEVNLEWGDNSGYSPNPVSMKFKPVLSADFQLVVEAHFEDAQANEAYSAMYLRAQSQWIHLEELIESPGPVNSNLDLP